MFRNDIALQQLWVEAIDGTIAGIAALTTQQEAEYMDVGWDIFETAIVTHRLAVHTHYQGRGIATALLLQAEREAARRNISVLRVDTSSKNMATQNLFPKLRYQFAGEITLFFRPCLRFFAMRNG